jgi:hypothetical protein
VRGATRRFTDPTSTPTCGIKRGFLVKHGLLKTMPAIIVGLTLMTSTSYAQEMNSQSGPSSIIAPTIDYAGVSGDEEKFREDWWMREGWAGGLDKLTLQRTYENDVSLRAEVHAIVPEENMDLRLELTKPEVGFMHTGYSEYRKYFDGTGGFFKPFSTSSFELDNDMHLDIGSLFLDVGLTVPDWPKVVVGYEHHFKEGRKSLIEWGSVTEGGTTRNIFPAFKEIDEETEIFKLEIEHDIGKVHVGDQFRYEQYRTGTTRFDEERNLDTDTAETTTVSEDNSHEALSNTFHMESYVNEKLYWSLGYLFTTLEGDAAFRMVTDPFGPEPFDKNWFTRSVDIDQESHVVNVNAMFGPFRDLALYAGLQAETTETEGDTDAVLDETLPGLGEVSPETVIVTRGDKGGLEETVGARYTRIPYTTLYAEGKWTQQNIDLFERELEDDILDFERSTNTDVERRRYTLGFNTSPIPKTTLSARYRRRSRDNEYNHLVDTEPGYSAFIISQDFTSDEITTKLAVRPSSRVKLSVNYQLVATDIDTQSDTTPPSAVQSGDYDADVYSASITVTPISKLYLTGLFSYQEVRSTAFDNGVSSITAYEGDIYMVLLTAGFGINDETHLKAEYLYTRSENFDDTSDDGLPLGLDNRRQGLLVRISRRISETMDGQLGYGFYTYDEESSGGLDDYTAHVASTRLGVKF